MSGLCVRGNRSKLSIYQQSLEIGRGILLSNYLPPQVVHAVMFIVWHSQPVRRFRHNRP
jgi:hypothetical protein